MRYFVAVAEEGQMTRAARRLQLAQPALSQAMARLEGQLGVRLLERNPRGVSLTRAGEAFLEKAAATLAAMDEMQATARSWARQAEGRLHVGFMSLTPPMMAGDLFPRFTSAHPDVTIEWRELGYPTLAPREWLGDADAALIWCAPTGAGLSSQPVRSSPLVVAMTDTHRLADRSELRVADVLDETFPGIVDWCDPHWLGYWGLDAYRGGPARRTDDGAVTPEEVASIVASGRAITTVPAIVAVPFAHLGIRAIPLLDAAPAVLTLVWPEGAATPLVEDLLDQARLLSPHVG
ncbi:MAG TPA: LysR family transcriptional regulator [Solirubrobacteraceae bacterium]|nr:LysR family transcriptional regulator [Solirubrobacteraceae bacterium]